jgi:hypothetical protein
LGYLQMPDIVLRGYRLGYLFFTEVFVTTLESVSVACHQVAIQINHQLCLAVLRRK